MNSVSEWFLQAREFRGNIRRCFPESTFRKSDMFRTGAIEINSEDSIILADVPIARPALKARPTCQMRFSGDVIANRDGRNAAAKLHDLTAQLVTDDSRWMDSSLGPCVPAIDMIIGPA